MDDEEDEEDSGILFPCEGDPESSLKARQDHRHLQEKDEVPELSVRFENCESSLDWDDYCQPGTTPPRCERQIKQERRANKHKRSPAASTWGDEDKKPPLYKSFSTADMSSDPPFLQQRRYTVPDVPPASGFVGKERRRRGSGKVQPTVKEEGEGKTGKKRYQKDRVKSRDDKVNLIEDRRVPSPTQVQFSQQVELDDEEQFQENDSQENEVEDEVDYSLHLPKQPDLTHLARPSQSEGVMYRSLQAQDISSLASPGHGRLQRSQSDAQFSLPYAGHVIVCPPERKKFYRNFLRTIKVYSQPQHNLRTTSTTNSKGITGTHIPRQRSEDLQADSPYDADMDSIWLELRAYLSNRDAMDQHQIDYEQRSEVYRVLDNISKYQFTTMDQYFEGTTNRDEYEQLMSLPSEDPTPQSSLTVRGEDDEAPETLKQQGSFDSDNSRDSPSPYPIETFLAPEQQAALEDIKKLLKEFEKAQQLYPTFKKMTNDFGICQTVQFKRRQDALIIWSKVTENLAFHLSRLSQWFGVRIYSIYTRPSSLESYSTPQLRTYTSSRCHMDRRSLLSQTSVLSSATGSSGIDPEQSLVRTSSLYLTQSSSASSNRLSSDFTQSFEESLTRGYRRFVDRTLKKKGLDWLMMQVEKFITPALTIAEAAMVSHRHEKTEEDEDDEEGEKENTPLMGGHSKTPYYQRATSTAPQSWVDEFSNMNLPFFAQLYLQLARVPLEMMQECMRLQLELRKAKKPSVFSIRPLVQDCRLTLQKAIDARSFYRKKVAIVTAENPAGIDLMDQEIASYEEDMKHMLQLYFEYVQSLVELAGGHRNLLEEEWTHTKSICRHVTGGEADAGLRFCYMACQLLDGIQDRLRHEIDSCCTRLHDHTSENPDKLRKQFTDVCWDLKQLTEDTRERCAKGLGFAKMLRKDLEIAAEFSVRCDSQKLMEALQSSEHVQVIIPQQLGCLLFVPHQISDNSQEILHLLRESFGHSLADSNIDWHESYLLIVGREVRDSLPDWPGQTVHLNPPTETILGVNEMQVEGVKMIASDSEYLPHNRTSFIRAMGGLVGQTNERTTSLQSVAERITDLKQSLCRLAHIVMETVTEVDKHLMMEESQQDLGGVYGNTMNNCYKMAFDYVHKVSQLLGEEHTQKSLGEEMLGFSQYWMSFVLNKCSRGHGVSPRWAQKGMEFLTLSCAPRMLATISPVRFENLKQQMEQCVDHIIGDASTPSSRKTSGAFTPSTPEVWQQRPSWQARARRPHHTMSVMQASPYLPQVEEVEKMDDPPAFFLGSDSSGMGSDGSPRDFTVSRVRPTPKNLFPAHSDHVVTDFTDQFEPLVDDDRDEEVMTEEGEGAKIRQIREEIHRFNDEYDCKLRKKKVIGKVTTRESTSYTELAKLARLHQSRFNWRRGRKIGEGQFGKVYECIILNKGEVNAVKVISLQESPHNQVHDILSEVGAYQKIRHKNIVKLYGVEIHQNELHLFMEYCNEGTLSTAARNGLAPQVIRRYTRDILRAVDHFHEKAIVHRDIKGGNIFLSSDSVKLGDFGLSVQLKNMTKTQPNEVKKQRGTIPYMAPEVVREQEMGRALDIWSVGCVVVEMITGKYPWIDHDNQFTILYLLGKGKHPPYPDDVEDEANEFLQQCFIPEPSERPSASELLGHTFVKVLDDDDQSP